MRRGSWKSSSFPQIAGVQWPNTVGSTLWGMASGLAVVPDIVLGLAEIALAFCQPLQVAFCGPSRSKSCVHQRWRGTRRSRTSRSEHWRAH